jgi:hypothetical protein
MSPPRRIYLVTCYLVQTQGSVGRADHKPATLVFRNRLGYLS